LQHSRDEAQILLRWSLQKGYVPLVKSATESRIYSNTRLYDFELDEDDMARLNALDKGKDGHVAWNPLDAP
jgi:diketogulonate reductase-like aldo/keto reductase